MTQDYYRPTHTFKDNVYNATQVRLYGISPEPDAVNRNRVKVGDITIDIRKGVSDEDSEGGKSNPYQSVDMLRLVTDDAQPIFVVAFRENKARGQSIGIIYGYAYEGHCYDLPKPAIMVLPVPAEEIPEDDCGYDEKADDGYKVWVVDKLSRCQHIEVSSGFVEQLVLDANMPGKRSPSTYRATMMYAHRSGRMPE